MAILSEQQMSHFLSHRLARLLLSLLLLTCASAGAATLLKLDHAQLSITAPAQSQPLSSRPETAALSGPWQEVTLPFRFNDEAALRKVGSAGTARAAGMTTRWFRISLTQLAPVSGPVALHILRWQAAGKLAVYADNQLLYRSPGTPAWNFFRHPALYIPLSETADAPLPQTLLLRLDTYPGSSGGISSMIVGPADAVYTAYSSREWLEYQFPFMMSAAFLAVGLFSFGIWLMRRRESIYLLVFVIAVCSITRRWHFYAGLEQLPVSDQVFGWLTYNALNWQIVALQYFAQLLHGRQHRWLNRTLLVFAAFMSLATLPLSVLQPGLVLLKPFLHIGPIVLGSLMTAFNVWDSWRSKSYEARLLASWMMVGLVFGIGDWVSTKYQLNIEGFYLTPYAIMVMFAVIFYILFHRYVSAVAETERSKEHLKVRLLEREQELLESHNRLRKIEHAQTLSMERQRLMQDMHDGLGSSLVGALRIVENNATGGVNVAHILKSCIDDLKLAIDSMEPVDADLLLLLATLRFRLGPQLQSTGMALDWEVQDVPLLDWLDPRNALHILRILQEAFANIIKHAHATRIVVATASSSEHVWVRIRDNGTGFDVAAAMHAGGKGLQNQRRRAEAVGAEITWQADANGSCMALRLPVQRGSADSHVDEGGSLSRIAPA
jgi:signal transduction histidine kinase